MAEAARLEKESNGARQAAQKQLDRLAVQIAKLVRLVERDESDEIPAELVASLKEKQIERRGLEERIRLLGAETNVTALHPTAAKSFGRSIEKLREMIERNPDDPACRMALGNVLDSIIVHPTEYGKPYEVSLYARLSAVMGGVDLFSAADEKTPAKQGHSRVLSQADARPCPNCHAISKPKRWQRALKIGTSLAANYAKTRKDWAQPGVPMVLGSRREVEGRAPW